MAHAWGYADHDGPAKWVESFPIAEGPRQSPIDIIPSQAQFDSNLKQIKLKYDPSTSKGILNNGHSFQVDFADDDNKSTLTGGPVTGTYRLKQFHFHWGSADERGSEHTIGGTKFPCEMGKFRSLLFSSDGETPRCMVDNFRPPQPLKGRKVRSSFR
ncbi:hypothetical protein SRHO_G00245740 [Serrasalmus rhombeus]